ncbi:MAG: hypothetical protein WCE25_12710, partial [Nitrososphaeraceae archaeon]
LILERTMHEILVKGKFHRENLIIHHNQQRIQQVRKRNVIDTHQIVLNRMHYDNNFDSSFISNGDV